MQSIFKLRNAVLVLIALNCVLVLCAAQGGNGGWGGGGSGAPGAPGGSGGRDGAPGAPGAPGGGTYYGAAAPMSASQLQWLMILMPLTLLLKYF